MQLHNEGREDNGGSKMKAEDYFQWTVASIMDELKLKAEFAQQMWGAAGSRVLTNRDERPREALMTSVRC